MSLDKYSKESYKHILFGFVNGQRTGKCFFCGKHKITVSEAIQNFMKFHSLNDDNFNVDSARVTYYEMYNKYLNSQKSVN